MTDYTELVKALRCENTGDDECGSSDCPYWSGLGCMDGQLMEDAADAIEELQQIAEHYEQSAKDWWQEAREYKIKSAEGITAEESKELIKRFKSISCGLIEQLPKRGKCRVAARRVNRCIGCHYLSRRMRTHDMATDRPVDRPCDRIIYEQDGGRMNDNVSHPAHYQGKHECIDLMREIYGDEAVRHFCICNAYKYRFRAGAKQGETAQSDIAKAEWYEAYVMEHLPMNEMLQSEKFIQSIRIGQGCNECDKYESEAET